MNAIDPLVRRYLEDGDEDAVEEVVRRTRRRLRRIAGRIVDRDAAEDCVQTAYLSLLHKRGAELAAPAWPWLVTAVVRLAYRRKAQALRRLEIAQRLAAPPDPPTPDGAAIRAEEARLLRDGIADLRPAYRDVVVLRELRGLSTEETAALLGITPANVRKRLERARTVLRSRLHPRVACYALWLIPGGLMNRKIVVTAVLLLALGGGAWLLHGLRGAPRAERAAGSAARSDAAPAAAGEPAAVADEEAAPSEPQGLRLTGRVVDPDGRPVSGARVVAVPARPGAPTRPAGAGGGVRTDLDGRFSLSLVGAASAWTAFANAEGLGPACRRGLAAGADVELQLTAAPPPVFGVVMDIRRRPVPGARVRWVGLFDELVVEREARADDEGRYELRDLPSPARFAYARGNFNPVAYVTAEGFAPLAAELGAPGGERHLVLGRGMRLTVDVVDEERKPVRAARVALRRIDRWPARARPGASPSPHHLERIAAATAGEDGAVRFAHAPAVGLHDFAAPGGPAAAKFVVDVCAPGFVRVTKTASFGQEGAEHAETVVLRRAGALTARVLDAAGHPVAGTRVVAYPQGPGFHRAHRRAWPEGRTGADGRLRLPGVPRGPVLLEIHRAGGPVSVRVEAWEAGDVTLARSTVVAARFRVVDESGAPVANAAIGRFGPRTDADGRARKRFRARTPTRDAVYAHGYAVARTAEFVPDAEHPPEVEVVLARGTSVSGTVTWLDGAPAAGAVVAVADGRVPAAAAFGHRRAAGTLYGEATVDADGRYRVGDVPLGPYHVRAYWYEYPGAPAHAVVEAAPRSDVDLVLPRAFAPVPTAAIVGTLLDAKTGERVPVAQVTCRKDRNWLRPRFVEPGRIEIAPVGTGTFALTVRAEGYPVARFDVVVERPDQRVAVDLTLPRGSDVRGTVTAADPAVSLAGVRCVLATVDEGILHSSAVLSENGAYAVSNVAPGRYRPRLSADPPLAAAGFPVIEVPATGAPAGLDFEAVPAGTLTFETPRKGVALTDPDGRVLERRRVALGVWHVPAGRYTLVAEDWTKTVNVAAGETVTID